MRLEGNGAATALKRLKRLSLTSEPAGPILDMVRGGHRGFVACRCQCRPVELVYMSRVQVDFPYARPPLRCPDNHASWYDAESPT